MPFSTWVWLALELTFAILVVGSPCPVSADGPDHVGIVVDFGNGQVETRCVPFSGDSISGMQALQLQSESGETFAVQTGFGGSVVCGIDGTGCPSSNCWCQCPVVDENCTYWTYWHLNGDEWASSGGGPAGYPMHDGDVDGWRWGHAAPPYGDGQPPPVYSYADICAGYLPQTYAGTVTAVQVCETISATVSYQSDCNGNGSATMTYTHSLTPSIWGAVPSMGKDDGAKSYTATVPITVSGSYDVDVLYRDPDGVVGEVQQRVVVPVDLPHADFAVSPSLVISGTVMHFTDRSRGGVPLAWKWNFGDGSAIAATQNPTHTYPMTGVVTVVLTSTIEACGSYVTGRQLSVVEPDLAYLPILLKGCAAGMADGQDPTDGF